MNRTQHTGFKYSERLDNASMISEVLVVSITNLFNIYPEFLTFEITNTLNTEYLNVNNNVYDVKKIPCL